MRNNSPVKLSQKIVFGAEKKEARYEIWDRELAGFGVRISPNGTKTFIVRYRAEGGGRTAPRRFITVGRYGVLTVDEARKQAKMLLGSAAKGDDPAGARQQHRQEMSVGELIDLYEREGVDHLRERTRRYTLARLRHHAVPLLGRKRLSDVRVGDVERFVQEVASGKTRREVSAGPGRIAVRGGAGAAAKAVRDLSAVFSFAVRREIVGSNPCMKARKPSDNQRTRYLTSEEVHRLGTSLTQLESEGANPKSVAIIRLLVLTGCRRNEIAGLRWEEVDFERGCLVLSESKTGRSVRPLGSAATRLLRDIPRNGRSPFVFPADRGDGHFQGTKKLWPLLLERANLTGVTSHTLRHTFGSVAASSGETLLMVGALLGHSNYRSTSIYAHLQDQPQRSSADRVSAALANVLDGRSPEREIQS